MTKHYHHYFYHYARPRKSSAHPSHPSQPGEDQSEWLSYFIANEEQSVAKPYYEISNDLKSYKSFKFDLKQTTCEVLWNKYFTR